jgi:hypothetical protein
MVAVGLCGATVGAATGSSGELQFVSLIRRSASGR